MVNNFETYLRQIKFYLLAGTTQCKIKLTFQSQKHGETKTKKYFETSKFASVGFRDRGLHICFISSTHTGPSLGLHHLLDIIRLSSALFAALPLLLFHA